MAWVEKELESVSQWGKELRRKKNHILLSTFATHSLRDWTKRNIFCKAAALKTYLAEILPEVELKKKRKNNQTKKQPSLNMGNMSALLEQRPLPTHHFNL